MVREEQITVCQDIDEALFTGREPDEDDLIDFFALIIDAVESDAKMPESLATMDKIKALVYADLCNDVDTCVEGGTYTSYDRDSVFYLGAIWGAYKILQKAIYEHREPQREFLRRRIVRDNRKLFQAIAENPGISTSELAEMLDEDITNIIKYEAQINEKALMVTTLIRDNKKRFYLSAAAQESYEAFVAYREQKLREKREKQRQEKAAKIAAEKAKCAKEESQRLKDQKAQQASQNVRQQSQAKAKTAARVAAENKIAEKEG